MKKIEKERLWIFSPVTNVVLNAEFTGCKDETRFTVAICAAVNSFQAFKSKVFLDDEGKSFFIPIENANYSIKENNSSIETLICEQEQKQFDIWNGEYLRFFYTKSSNGFTLLLIAHHIIGDGLSFSFLLESILKAMSGEKLELVPDKEIDIKTLSAKSKLSFPIRFMMGGMNKKWGKSEKKFTIQDYTKMTEKYWEEHSSFVKYEKLNQEEYHRLINFSKETKLTVNTLITTALLSADSKCNDCGQAVSIREENNRFMGNYASGISIKYKYNDNIDFISNAKKVQKLMNKKTDNVNSKFFLMNFMNGIKPNLIDAIYFSACGFYENTVAHNFASMFGYTGNAKGLSVTNLKLLPIVSQIENYNIKNVIFIPPLVLNAKRIIGIVSLGEKLYITMHIDGKKDINSHSMIFLKAIKKLKELK
ncbi:condensation domain-containing protein [[Clostridium] fimetarium]|uniref:Condensation domain-containing protein n=1 Tax=[Clostridium] fimetarium TaxID=99656 RepID=A0A1I0PJ08_9FIRM|nr:condensation domain-containing protein [[Clostridium] fimetarium]SEW14177.1 Condensation domain-containing protein [[Clostridium] fimetarium]